MANASSLVVTVLMPMAAAATSPSRMAIHARPSLERYRLVTRITAPMIRITISTYYAIGSREKLKHGRNWVWAIGFRHVEFWMTATLLAPAQGPVIQAGSHGWSMPPMALMPPVHWGRLYES